MRIWFKLWKGNRLLKDMTIQDDSSETRTHKVFSALENCCHTWDLAKPLWLDSSIREFQNHGKTKFRVDSFMEDIPFDALEIQILEED